MCISLDGPWSCAHPSNGFLGFFAQDARTRVFRRGVIIPTPCHAKTCGQTRRRDAESSPGRIRRTSTWAARTIDICHVARETPDSEERRGLGIGPNAARLASRRAGVPVRARPGAPRDASAIRPPVRASRVAPIACQSGCRKAQDGTAASRALLRLRRPDSGAIGATPRSVPWMVRLGSQAPRA